MFAARRVTVCSVLLATLALALLLGLRGVPSAAAEGEAAVTIVRELTERRTEYASTYLLSNGQLRTVFSQAPVNYRDADGAWQPVDTTLVANPDGSWTTKAVAVPVTFRASAAGAAAVTLSCGKYELTLDLVGAAAASPATDASAATYAGIATATDAVYEATGDGLKETLVLASNAAPESFTFTLAHPGLALRADADGVWGLYSGGAREPTLLLGAVSACDSSADEGGEPAWCEEARMRVVPGAGQSTVTVALPRAWLEAKERVYPVRIDPNLFTRNPTDTYISQGYPGTAYGSSTELLCGEVSSQTEVCKTLVKFPQVDNPNNIPEDAHISAATFSIRQFWQPANPHDRTHVYRLYGTCTDWGDSVTWNSMNITGKQEISPDNLDPHGSEWMDVGCAGVIQGWVDGSFANRGFLIAQKPDEGSTYARKFRSGEYADTSYRPKLSVDWEEPTMASDSDATSYVVGDTVTVTVTLGAIAESAQITDIRMGVNRTAASAEDRRGVFAWFASPPADDAHWVYARAGANGGYFA